MHESEWAGLGLDDFERELKFGFLEEAAQLLNDAEQCFLIIEAQPNDKPTLEKIFRIAHNLKGSAKAVGFDGLGEFTHQFENLLIRLKEGKLTVNAESINLLLRCNDHVSKMLAALKDNLESNPEYAGLLGEIKDFIDGVRVAPPSPEPLTDESESPSADSFKDEREEAVPAVVTATPVQPSPAAPHATTTPDESIRVSIARLDKLLNYVGEMVIYQTVLKEQVYSNNPDLLRKSILQMGKVTKEIQDLSMSLRMIPLKQTFQKMQRIVRDTSGSLGKKVLLTIQGDDTEVDKTVLENLGDPLVHLIRNAVDHGVETNEARAAAGKTETAEIVLKAFHRSGSLIIEVRDNGAGMDANRLRAKAVEKGILKPGQTLSDKDAYNLVFHSGFSTKAVVSDVSGRGVGMDVVKTNIESLQGEIQIETELGKGSCFRVRLPLTLAIIDGMVIRSLNERYIIPLSHVHESLRPPASDIEYVTGLGEVLSLRGESIPLVRLRSVLTATAPQTPIQESTVIVCRPEGQPFAILVDDIIGQHQVVVKQLGQEHSALKGFSGSAILGDGRPALILELPEIIKRFRPSKKLSA